MTSQRIIVGVDGSPGARSAVRWAADECRIRGATLLVIHALDSRLAAGDGATAGYDVGVEQLLASLASAASMRQPGVPVTTLFTRDAPADSLIDLSPSAAMIVVGASSDNGLRTTMLGSVSTRTAAHALCPVAVIPEQQAGVRDVRGSRVVLVGESSGPPGDRARDFVRQDVRPKDPAISAVPRAG